MARLFSPPLDTSSEPLGVLLLQMGGPANPAEVEPFVAALLGDPAMVQLPFWLRPFQPRLAARWARKRSPMTRERYAGIGGGSPLVATTDALAAKLERRLREQGRAGAVVRPAYRYSRPDATTALAQLRAAGARRLLLLSLYPHFSRTTTGSSLRAVEAALRPDNGWREAGRVEAWGDHPSYIELLAAQVREALARVGDAEGAEGANAAGTALLCTAHGLPESHITRGDPYLQQVRASFAALRERLPSLACRLGFQSRVGRRKWLGPTSAQVVRELAERGCRRLLVLPLGFVCEQLETLYDMDVLLSEAAAAAGITSFHRLPAFDHRERFVQFLATLIAETLARETAGAEETT